MELYVFIACVTVMIIVKIVIQLNSLMHSKLHLKKTNYFINKLTTMYVCCTDSDIRETL